MYVEKLTIENFKCFERAELELNYPGRPATKTRPVPKRLKNVNLLLGGNGSGKTSVFRSLALGVLGRVLTNSGFQAEFLVRRAADHNSPDHATIQTEMVLTPRDLSPAENIPSLFSLTGVSGSVTINIRDDFEYVISDISDDSEWKGLYGSLNPTFFLVGYGANRRSERPEGYSEKGRSPRYQRVAGLFEDHVGLIPFSYAYTEFEARNKITSATNLLNSLLPEEVKLTNERDSQRRPLFDRYGVLLPFTALSDGFRTFVGWVWDLLYQLALIQPSKSSQILPKEMTGVVIVDEIDLFLHPEWQREVIEKVATTFPKLQFLFSTHSPLVAGTLEPENIFVMEQEPDGTATVKQYRESIYGLTANEILTGAYFALPSTRAPGVKKPTKADRQAQAEAMLTELDAEAEAEAVR